MVDVDVVTIPDPGLLTVQYAKPVPTELANFTARRFDLSKRSTGLLNMTCQKKAAADCWCNSKRQKMLTCRSVVHFSIV